MANDNQEQQGSSVDVDANQQQQQVDDAAQQQTPGAAHAGGDQSSPAESVEELQDRLLRTQAELENFRKRSRREIEERAKYAALPLVNDLLAVIDNLDRALEAAEGNDDSGGLLAGVQMVSQQMQRVIKQHNVTRIEAIGQPFDPNLHEAVQMEPSDQYPANVVSRELRVGYQLHDRVIRPSQVFVSTGAPQ